MKGLSILALALLCASACPGAERLAAGPVVSPLIPFHYLQGHFLVVPVRLNDSFDAQFILDTGIGVNLISTQLAERLGCRLEGSHSGQRMSGQEVRFPLTKLTSLAVGRERLASVPCGVFDFEANHFGVDPSVTGFLGLSFFRHRAFTVDYRSKRIHLEDAASLARRRVRGTTVPVRITEKGPEVSISAPIRVAGAHDAWVEIDTGSPSTTLDLRYLPLLGLSPASARVRLVSGSDETGFLFVRYFAKDRIPMRFAATASDPGIPVRTMFQKIIYDGLIGDSLLRNYVVTYDLPHGAMILAR